MRIRGGTKAARKGTCRRRGRDAGRGRQVWWTRAAAGGTDSCGGGARGGAGRAGEGAGPTSGRAPCKPLTPDSAFPSLSRRRRLAWTYYVPAPPPSIIEIIGRIPSAW